jgi:hypothetical protein
MKRMKRFTVKFIGRLKGAIGVTFPINAQVTAQEESEVRDKLYESYEHITRLKVVHVDEMGYSVYHDLVKVMAPTELDHHESDLYVLVNEKSRPIVEKYVGSASVFKSNLDGKLWYDLPFAFAPFWEKAQGHAADLSRSVPRKASRKKSAPRLSR